MKANKTLNKDILISLIRSQYPQYKTNELNDFFEALEEVVSKGLDDGYKIKLGKLLTLEPQIKEARKHYSNVNGESKFIMLPKRVHIKINKLQRLKDIETKHLN